MSIMADLHNLKINDPFLGQYQRLVRDVVIPYQWMRSAIAWRSRAQSCHHQLPHCGQVLKKVSSTAWSFRTVTWRNGWKPWRGRFVRNPMLNWKKPPVMR